MNGQSVASQGRLSTIVGGLTGTSGQRILKNVVALSIAQVATYLLPLIVVPYTTAVLGPRCFGVVAVTQAVVAYSTLVTNYGFSFSATRLAAIAQNDAQRLSEIVVHVWAAKFVLMVACLAISISVFAIVPSLRPALGAYLCGFVVVLGNVLYLDWFFQAIEEMKWITVINVIPKLLLTPLIFVVVKAESDYVWLLLIQSGTFLTSGIAGALFVRQRLGRRLPPPCIPGILAQLNNGWQTFLASASINLYTSTNIVLLGLFSNATVVGYYSAGQKVVGAVQSLWGPCSQSLYPHFCKLFNEDFSLAARRLRYLTSFVVGLTMLGATVICIAAPHVVPTYLGRRFENSTTVIQILIFSVCAVTTNNVLGLHGLLAAGLDRALLRVVSAAAAVNLALAPVSILLFGHLGLAATCVTVEVLICVVEFRILRRRSAL